MLKFYAKIVRPWLRQSEGTAATEAAMIFPILMLLLLGTFDLGNAILTNQKAIRASQVTADIIARNRNVTGAEINEAIEAGRLALEPFSTATYGVDVISIRFDDDAQPVIVWRETRNMSPMADVLSRVSAMAEAGNGVLVVAVNYDFEPLFSGFIIDEILMQEIAFARGRKSPVVARS